MKFKFQAFHPYMTYSNDGRYFVNPDGRPSFTGWTSQRQATNMNGDALDLWRLGKRAFEALGEIKSKDEFDELYKYNLKAIHLLRLELGERIAADPNSIVFVDLDDENYVPDVDDFSDSTIVNITWQAVQPQSGKCLFLGGMFLFSCLQEIDNAIIGMCLDGEYAVSGALAAAEAYANFQAIESGNDNLQRVRSEFAARAAIERYKRDPKQTAKALIKECWDEWQETPSRYRTQSVFANDMLKKVQTDHNGDPIISFDTVLKKWIPKWTKEKK